METEGSAFYFIYYGNNPAGYLKINYSPAQTDINDPDSLEVERIYVKHEFKKKGLGAGLISHAAELAQESGKRYLWLGVWEKNKEAIAFYLKMGFRKTGVHSFKLGNELQSDIIMKKEIAY